MIHGVKRKSFSPISTNISIFDSHKNLNIVIFEVWPIFIQWLSNACHEMLAHFISSSHLCGQYARGQGPLLVKQDQQLRWSRLWINDNKVFCTQEQKTFVESSGLHRNILSLSNHWMHYYCVKRFLRETCSQHNVNMPHCLTLEINDKLFWRVRVIFHTPKQTSGRIGLRVSFMAAAVFDLSLKGAAGHNF